MNFDTGNSFISGLDPLEYLKRFRKYLTHAHIKDVSAGLAAAVRGEETGIATSEVPIGGGVNAENIKNCLEYLKQSEWDGVVSIECYGSDENIRKSVEFCGTSRAPAAHAGRTDGHRPRTSSGSRSEALRGSRSCVLLENCP